ncbi:hypothetical protein CNY89_28745, partial [Amaricoccus sp. HAR-UPW-R2A-40]
GYYATQVATMKLAGRGDMIARLIDNRITFLRAGNQPGGREPGAENLANLAPGYYATQVATMKLAGRGDMIARLIDNRITFLRAG